ncbi:MAG: PAS domain S-box protein [Cyanobacteria bacterium SZAS LIN-2]|nr:PAS domain S-box protein [Cyanobacteria bacterium SZAS LIN-3]MBS1995036.1 PAS domain S-box protein [Cyanobacteria bacterium SZAS LIN-2]
MNQLITALIVEKNSTQADQLRSILQSAEIVSEIATDANQALELFSHKIYDIVLTDINMPGLSGYELCKRLKARRADVPVVLLTTLNNPSDIVRGLECGASNFVAKPYDREHLLNRVRHIVRNQRLRSTGAITGGVPIQVQSEHDAIAIDVSSAQVMDFLISTFEDYARASQRELEAKQQEKERALEAENYKVREELVRKEMEAQKEREIASLLAQKAEELRRSEERYNLAIEGSHDGIWDWDLVSNTCFYSDRCKSQLGYAPDEIDENDMVLMKSLLHPDDTDRLYNAVKNHLQNKVPFDVEYRARTKSGEYKWLHSRGQAVWNAEGKPVRMAGSHRDISERIESQQKLNASNQALAEREARMRVIVDTAPDGIFTVGGDGTIESASEKMHRMFGYSSGQLPGKHIFDLLPNFFEASFLKDQLTTWQGKIFGAGRDLDGRRKDGSIIPIELALSVLSLGNRQIITGIARDVTDRKRADERLHIQYNITKVLAESSGITEAAAKILQVLSKDSRWTALGLWLKQDGSMLLKSAQINGDCEGLEKLIAGIEGTAVEENKGLLGKVWASNEARWTSLTAKHKDEDFLNQVTGSDIRSALAFPVRGNNGELIGLIEIFSCKTDALDQEMLLTWETLGSQIGQFVTRVTTERLLQESEHLLMQLAENVPEVFWIASPTFHTLYYASPAYETIWGRSVKELYEDAPAFLTFVAEQDRVKVQEHVKAVRRSQTGLEIEYDIVRPDGTIRNIAARTTGVFDENGKCTRICGIARDVTEKKQAERRVSEFYSTVSHELRTPLTSIRGSLGLIEGGLTGPLSEKTLQFIQIARAESDRLIRLINEILDIRKIEAGKLELKLRATSAEELAATVAESLKGMAETANVYLDNTVRTDVKLHCDRDRITQVLTNLVSNAIKFSSINQTVIIKFAHMGGGTYRFSVMDRGPGIPPAEQSKLFGLFQQLDASDSRSKGGTGLGLAISKAIIDLHGGKIGIDSQPGEGSTFWFELPQAATGEREQDITGTRMRIADMSTSGSRKQGGPLKVLVVEDDLSTRELIIHQLKSLGLDCLVASDGDAAIEITRSKHPDLIVLDVGVPKTDGFEVIKNLRESPASATPLVIYTSRDLLEEERARLTLGPTRHLIKSRTSEQGLLDAIKELLPRKH